MKSCLLSLIAVAAMATFAVAQCNPQPRLDQTNLNLGQILSSQAQSLGQAGGGGGCQTCQQGVGGTSASANAIVSGHGVPAPLPGGQVQPLGVDAATVEAVIQALAAQGRIQGGQKALTMQNTRTRVAASSEVYSDSYAYVPPAPMPAPQPLAYPVALALPGNSATATALAADDSSGGCSGGRRGFFRRANRSRTRAVTVSNGQRSVATASSVAR